MARLFGAEVIARVVFVDTPTMGETESSTMPINANSGLYLDNAPFGISWRNQEDGFSGDGSGI